MRGGGSARIDGTTYGAMQEGWEEYMINIGRHYYDSGYVSLDTSDTLEFVVDTPNDGTKIHITWSLQGTKDTTVAIYEDASYTGGTGTVATPRNNNRNYSDSSAANIRVDPTGISVVGATLIGSARVGTSGSVFTANIIGAVTRDDKLILKENTTYLIRITSNADDNVVTYQPSWWEWVDLV